MRAGSIVIWDQRVAHGSFPNASDNPRFAQFIKMFPLSMVSSKRRKLRNKAVQLRIQHTLMVESGPANQLDISEVGSIVFGCSDWELIHFRHPYHEATLRVLQKFAVEKTLLYHARMALKEGKEYDVPEDTIDVCGSLFTDIP